MDTQISTPFLVLIRKPQVIWPIPQAIRLVCFPHIPQPQVAPQSVRWSPNYGNSRGFAFRRGHMKLDTIWECFDPPKVGMNHRRFNNTKGAQHRKWDDTASNLTWQTQEFQLPMRDLPFLVYSTLYQTGRTLVEQGGGCLKIPDFGTKPDGRIVLIPTI